MKGIAPALVLIAALLTAGPGEAGKREVRDATNPSALVAAEIAFNRMAQDKGQWTAFREFAAEDAVMFVPLAVKAHDWLKGRADPPKSVIWQPHEVWMSCDGSLGATRGAWQRPDGSTGYFTTVWQRQKKGEYKWVMDQGDVLAAPLAAPDLLTAKIAGCNSRPAAQAGLPPSDAQVSDGSSNDGTLTWRVAVLPDRSRQVTVSFWDGGQWQSAIDAKAGP